MKRFNDATRSSDSDDKAPIPRRVWFNSTVSGMASYLDAAAIVTTGTALVLYQQKFGLDGATIGILSAALTFAIAVGAIIGGRLGDRFGRSRVFVVTMLVYAVGALLLTVAPNEAVLFIGLPLIGLAAGADLPVSIAMIAESAPKGSKGKMVTFSHTLWIAGVLVVSLIGILVGNLGVTGGRIMYAHLLVVAVVVLILRTRLPESTEWTAAHTAAITVKTSASEINTSSLRSLFRGRYLAPLIALGLFYAILNLAANTNGQFSTYLYVNVAHASVSTASAINFVGFALDFIGLFTLMRLVDTRFRMVGFVIGTLISLTGFLVPLFAGVTVAPLIVFTLLYSIGGSISGEPMFKVWSQELFPTLHRSTAQGITIGFTRVVAAIGALLTPAIIATGAQNLFLFLAGCVVVSGLIGLLWITRIKRADDAPEPVEAAAAPATLS